MVWYNTSMKHYKKRTIAFCIATVLTVLGSFGAEYYNNTLREIRVDIPSKNYINVITFTEKRYDNPIETTKVDNNTFVLILKNTNSTAPIPNIESYENIKSINISTYPYTTDSEGYTKIVIKTAGEPTLYAVPTLFIPERTETRQRLEENNEYKNTRTNEQEYTSDKTEEEESDDNENNSSESDNKAQNQRNNAVNTNPPQQIVQPNFPEETEDNSFEHMMVVLSISVLLIIIGLIFMLSKEKMASVLGEQGKIDLKDDEEKTEKKEKRQNKTKKLKSTINKLDKQYSSKLKYTDLAYNKTSEYTASTPNNDIEKTDIEEEANVVVDLDLLYQESKKPSSANSQVAEDNSFDDLADLLTSFTMAETTVEEPEEEPFDENLYNSVINKNSISFSDSDINKINQLLMVELSEELTEELKQHTNTPKAKKLTQEQVLEELLSTYSIKQNIDFSEEDVNAIKKLMNVELGPDFVKDFSTNPVRTKVVAQKIKESTGQKAHRTSDILTLNVKNMLPDLSEELRKQGGRKIESEVKPAVVYYSEGYEYKKLNVADSLPDISKIGEYGSNEYKPSYEEPIVATGYDVSTLSIKDALPDLADVKANPQKYETPAKEKPKADETTLLKSLANVTFKPFYEDVENELNQFDNFEVIRSYSDYQQQEETPLFTDIEPVLYSEPVLDIKPVFEQQKPTPKTKSDDNASKLLKLIETQQAQRAIKKQNAEEAAAFKRELEIASKHHKNVKTETKEETPAQEEKCIIDGKAHTILKTVKCTPNSECRILQYNDKFTVLGIINGQEIVLKQYDSLNNSAMFIRQDKADKFKYLVKVGLHKFIIKITKDNMEFVMDLC